MTPTTYTPVEQLRRDRSVLHQSVTPGTLHRIIAFASPYRRLLALFGMVVVVDSGIAAVNPLLFKAIIDRGISGHHIRLIVVLALIVAALAVLDACLALAQRIITARVGEGLVCDMRTQVFDHVQRMSLAFFTRTQTGSLVSRLNGDVLGAQTAFTDLMSNVFGNFVLVLFVLTAMFVLSWPITLIALVMLPIVAFPVRKIGIRLAGLTRQRYDQLAALVSTMTERFNVAGALLVKLYGDPDAEASSFANRAGTVRDLGVQIALVGRVFFVTLTLVAALATSLVYGWGGVLAANGTLQIGTVVALAAYLSRLYVPLSSLAGANVDVMTTLVAFDRVFEILRLEPALSESPVAVALVRGPSRFEFRNVGFAYPPASKVSLASLEFVTELDARAGVPVLFDVSFAAEPGHLVALVGRSGAGKTTISMLLARLYDTDTGSVSVDGVDVRDATIASLRAKIGVVTQDPHLFHDTLRANLAYGRPGAGDDELMCALAQAQIADVVEQLPDGLATVVGDRGYRLSGGEKQRVALARLILKAPDIVILDEATAHLDSAAEVAVQRALQIALADRTSLVIAHRLSTVRRADCLIVVEGGRIVERGTHRELLAAGGTYAELYRTQFEEQPAAMEEGW